MNYDLAGWPLRGLSLASIAEVIAQSSCLVEIPKDLLDSVSAKSLHALLSAKQRPTVLAGTTDFAKMAGLSWGSYRSYLAIQIAYARFLGCQMFRVFLGADSRTTLEPSLERLALLSRELQDIEVVVETHGGFESTKEGFLHCVTSSPIRFVVDFANIADKALVDVILKGKYSNKIAYFHVRNLPGYCEADHLLEVETRAKRAYRRHIFLWEPKAITGLEAVTVFNSYKKLQMRPPIHVRT
jgi:hypothetical protein